MVRPDRPIVPRSASAIGGRRARATWRAVYRAADLAVPRGRGRWLPPSRGPRGAVRLTARTGAAGTPRAAARGRWPAGRARAAVGAGSRGRGWREGGAGGWWSISRWRMKRRGECSPRAGAAGTLAAPRGRWPAGQRRTWRAAARRGARGCERGNADRPRGRRQPGPGLRSVRLLLQSERAEPRATGNPLPSAPRSAGAMLQEGRRARWGPRIPSSYGPRGPLRLCFRHPAGTLTDVPAG